MSNNLKGITKSNIEYTGIVTLSQYTRGKKFTIAKIHNVGGKPLFDFLVDCLMGDFDIASSYRPTKIALLNVDEEKNITAAENTSFIHLLTKPEKVYSEDEGIVKYSFIIPQDWFAGTNFNAVGLYTSTATTDDIENYAYPTTAVE